MTSININKEKFGQLIHKEKPVLVDFWAPWCGYCRRIGAAYEKNSVWNITRSSTRMALMNEAENPVQKPIMIWWTVL